ncbi:hypothetical protein Leryth_015678, partial [Lithospermum erythrorhizon]
MQSLGIGGDNFFDCVDNLSSQESCCVEEDLGYEIWVNEPKSVKERRSEFLNRMGLVEFGRMIECSGAVSGSSSVMEGDSLVCLERDFNGEAKCMDDEFDDRGVHDSCSGSENGNVENSFPAEERLPLDLVNGAVELCSDATSSSSKERDSYVGESKKVDATKKKMSKWWKPFARQLRKIRKGNSWHVTKKPKAEGFPLQRLGVQTKARKAIIK